MQGNLENKWLLNYIIYLFLRSSFELSYEACFFAIVVISRT